MKRIISIAGSDSGGGAGVQADLKTISLLGSYGMTVLTAITAQNTVGVDDIYSIPDSFVAKQLDAVLCDIGADAVKTGMLYKPEIVEIVAQKLKQYKIPLLVIDPVMVSKSKYSLLTSEAQKVLLEKLVPQAFLITPNIPEAEAITGISVINPSRMREAAKRIHALGSRNVLIKGGHLEGSNLVDILFDGTTFYDFESKRKETLNTHGTGCTYSAAITTFLAQGLDIFHAVSRAKKFIERAIRFSLDIGKGHGPTNPYDAVSCDWERYKVIQALKQAFKTLKESCHIAKLLPEVQSNLAYSLRAPLSYDDVAAFPGRFVRIGDKFVVVRDPEFGKSRHIANIILTANRFNGKIRSAMNIRYTKELVEKCLEIGFSVAEFDRGEEPGLTKEVEGSTLAWGVAEAIRKNETFPDVIFDRGEVGKEPMIRILGNDPDSVVRKVLKLTKACF